MSFSRTVSRIASAVALALVLSGCGIEHARMVRDAQDAITAAATRENETKFQFDADLASSKVFDPGVEYETAVGLINQAVRDAEGALKTDQLYGTALTVRAVALWRLGEYGDARRDAERVLAIADQATPETRVWPRDAVICAALVPLMQIDVLGRQAETRSFADGWAAMDPPAQAEAVDRWLGVAEGVAGRLRSAASRAPTGHPVRSYLVQADLELSRVIFVGVVSLLPEVRSQAHADRYHTQRDAAWLAFDRLVNATPAGEQGPLEEARTYYSRLLQNIAP